MVRQMYQIETKLKAQVKELEEKLNAADKGQPQIATLTQQLEEEKAKVVKKTAMVRQMY